MRKTLLTVPMALAMLSIVSCNNDSYRHQVAVAYPSGTQVLFADQTSDSVIFITYDSYKVTSLNSSWLKVLSSKDYPSEYTLQNPYYMGYRLRVNLQAEPNATDAPRLGQVNVYSYSTFDDWAETAGAFYYQVNWHDVQRPYPQYGRDDNGNAISATFAARDSFSQVVDTLRFMAYDDWKLTTSEDSYAKPDKLSGGKGYQTILLSMEPNELNDTLYTTLTLQSAHYDGVKTVITRKQAPKGYRWGQK